MGEFELTLEGFIALNTQKKTDRKAFTPPASPCGFFPRASGALWSVPTVAIPSPELIKILGRVESSFQFPDK